VAVWLEIIFFITLSPVCHESALRSGMRNPTKTPVSTKTAATISLPASFLNRELSILAFNWRVLAQAQDPDIPLLERLKFLCIVSSNLDEFFEVRVASLLARDREEGSGQVIWMRDFDQVSAEAHRLVEQQYRTLNEQILPSLAEQGIHLLRHLDRTDVQQVWVKDYFEQEVRPLLTPIVLDPAHPFPQVVNKSLNFIVELADRRDESTACLAENYSVARRLEWQWRCLLLIVFGHPRPYC
jgi:polyphosphate kinase